jgi:hypothetical protein
MGQWCLRVQAPQALEVGTENAESLLSVPWSASVIAEHLNH